MFTRSASSEDHVSSHSPALLFVPAMGVPATYYRPFVEQLEFRGYPVTFVDCDISSKATGSAGRGGYAEIVEDRIRSRFRVAEASVPTGRVVVLGHSLGGQLGLVFAGGFEPEVPVILIGSGSAFFGGFAAPRKWVYLIVSQAIAGLSVLLGSWPGHRLGFAGRQTKRTMCDWARNVRTGRYGSRNSSFDYGVALRGFRGPLAVINIAGDLLAPPSTTTRLTDRTGAAVLRRATYSPRRARRRPGSHFTWARDVPGVVPQIIEWLSDPDFIAPADHEREEFR